MVKSHFLIFEKEKNKKINPVVSKCYRCRYSHTDAGTTVQNKGSKGKYEDKIKDFSYPQMLQH
jgi:hypothetical protein